MAAAEAAASACAPAVAEEEPLCLAAERVEAAQEAALCPAAARVGAAQAAAEAEAEAEVVVVPERAAVVPRAVGAQEPEAAAQEPELAAAVPQGKVAALPEAAAPAEVHSSRSPSRGRWHPPCWPQRRAAAVARAQVGWCARWCGWAAPGS